MGAAESHEVTAMDDLLVSLLTRVAGWLVRRWRPAPPPTVRVAITLQVAVQVLVLPPN